MQQSGGTLPDCPNVLLSIKPKHADSILEGDKRYEYRRTAPADGPPLRLVLYASAPQQAVVGVAWSHNIKSGEPEELVEETVHRTPHKRSEVLDYLDGVETGHAISIGSFRRFDTPIPRTDLIDAGHQPAQNFRYIGTVPAHPNQVEPAFVDPGDGTQRD
jgi:predicted transcriptional regulator